jgi:hypothetical protein
MIKGTQGSKPILSGDKVKISPGVPFTLIDLTETTVIRIIPKSLEYTRKEYTFEEFGDIYGTNN